MPEAARHAVLSDTVTGAALVAAMLFSLSQQSLVPGYDHDVAVPPRHSHRDVVVLAM